MGKKEFDLDNKINKVYTDVAVLNSRFLESERKIDEIHKLLVGNGKPGLVNEFNRWKGFVRGISVAFTILVTLSTSLAVFL